MFSVHSLINKINVRVVMFTIFPFQKYKAEKWDHLNWIKIQFHFRFSYCFPFYLIWLENKHLNHYENWYKDGIDVKTIFIYLIFVLLLDLVTATGTHLTIRVIWKLSSAKTSSPSSPLRSPEVAWGGVRLVSCLGGTHRMRAVLRGNKRSSTCRSSHWDARKWGRAIESLLGV